MDLSSRELARLRRTGQDVPVTVQVGKAGITGGLIEEIADQLKREALVKVRLLRSARAGDDDRNALAASLAERAGAHLVEVRGNTCVLYRP